MQQEQQYSSSTGAARFPASDAARTSVNESRSTRTALLHAIFSQTYWMETHIHTLKTSPQGKICHRSLICFGRNYVECGEEQQREVCGEGVERIPVTALKKRARFQQLTLGSDCAQAARRKAINFDYLESYSRFFSCLLLFFLPRSESKVSE